MITTLSELRAVGPTVLYVYHQEHGIAFPLVGMEKYSGIEFSEGSDLRWMSISMMTIFLVVSVLSVCLERPR